MLENYPLSYWVLSKVEALDPPLPTDSLTKIYQYQDSSSTRGEKMDSLYALTFDASMQYQWWLYRLQGDTVNTLDELRDSLALETYDPGFQMLLADLYMIDSLYDKAADIWDSVPKYSQEIKDWATLRGIQLTFEEQGWDWTWLDSTGEAGSFADDIEILAASNTSAGWQAKHILYAFQGDSVPLVFEGRDAMKNGGSAYNPLATKPDKPMSYIKMYPNPAANTITIDYDLGEAERATLELFDLLGSLVAEIPLDKPKGELTIDVSKYPIGAYLYQVMGLKNEASHNGRLLIIR